MRTTNLLGEPLIVCDSCHAATPPLARPFAGSDVPLGWRSEGERDYCTCCDSESEREAELERRASLGRAANVERTARHEHPESHVWRPIEQPLGERRFNPVTGRLAP